MLPYGNYENFCSWGFPIMPIIFLGIIVFIVYKIFTNESKKTLTSTEILQKRYASGEISKKEFDTIKIEISS